MRYSSIQIAINPTQGGFYQTNSDVNILGPDGLDKLSKNGFAITEDRTLTPIHPQVMFVNIFFTEKHPLFNIGVLKTSTFDLPVDSYDENSLFQFLLNFFNKHKLNR
jgi:hypothetical protein